MLFPKSPMTVFVERLPSGNLRAKITATNLPTGATVFEGSGYSDESELRAAIRLNRMIPKDRYSEGIDIVYAA